MVIFYSSVSHYQSISYGLERCFQSQVALESGATFRQALSAVQVDMLVLGDSGGLGDGETTGRTSS